MKEIQESCSKTNDYSIASTFQEIKTRVCSNDDQLQSKLQSMDKCVLKKVEEANLDLKSIIEKLNKECPAMNTQ